MFPVQKTITSFSKAKLFSLMFACAALAVTSVIILASGVTALSVHFTQFDTDWINTVFSWGTGILSGVVGWFILPVFMVIFAGVFQEVTIYRVEQTFYPDDIRTVAPRFWPDLWHDVKFTAKALLLNIIILPLYLFGIGFFISILLNSYLLGHEFFESAAGYHLGKTSAKELSKQNKPVIYGSGFVIAMMTLIPVLNLFMPIIAIVWMVHVYHNIKEKS